MDLPADKKQAVLGMFVMRQKRLMLRDQDKQLQAMPTKFYLSKFAYVLEADTVKVCEVKVIEVQEKEKLI